MARKLKNINGPWYAGIDLDGTSVGFVATDEYGEVLYHKGQPVMGARCFKEALHASEARMPRTARRRLQRARGREREMERIFAPAITPTDPDFFVRRRMSYKLMRDDIAADPAAAWQGLLDGYPTLAHLDVDLMESDTPRDPRLIFWAVANHVVRRGHFLMEGHDVTSANSDPSAQVEALVRELDALGEACGEAIELDGGALADMGGSWTAREFQKAVSGAVSVTGDDIDAKIARAQAKALGDLVAGYKANMDAFALEGEQIGKVSVSDADLLDEFLANCPDRLAPTIEAARGLYSAWRLQGLLSFAPGKTLSHNQVAQYEAYGERFRIKGQKTAGPVRQLALDTSDTRLLRIVERMVDGEQPSPRRDLESDAQVLCRLWARLLELAPVNFPRISKVLKLGALKTPEEVFSDAEADDIAKTVRAVAESEVQVVELLSGIRGTADVRSLGGSAFAGTLSMTFDKITNDPKAGFAIVDISAAGLHERVSTLG